MTLKLVYTNNSSKTHDFIENYILDVEKNTLHMRTYKKTDISTSLTDVDHIVKIHHKTIYKNGKTTISPRQNNR